MPALEGSTVSDVPCCFGLTRLAQRYEDHVAGAPGENHLGVQKQLEAITKEQANQCDATGKLADAVAKLSGRVYYAAGGLVVIQGAVAILIKAHIL